VGTSSSGRVHRHVHADDVQTLVIPGIGHWLAEQASDDLVAALTEFLAPYRDGSAAAPDARPRAAVD
jgi:pimeloyl-ACP methyl ester carboxylesterase